MRLTKNSCIQERMCAHGIIRGMANQSSAQSLVLLHSAQLKMALIARRTWESIVHVAIVISSNLKWLEPWASKKACRYRDQGLHTRLYANAPNEYLGQENCMRLIMNERDAPHNEKIRYTYSGEWLNYFLHSRSLMHYSSESMLQIISCTRQWVLYHH